MKIRLNVALETILKVISESYIHLNLNKNIVFVNFRLASQNQLFATIKVSMIDNNISRSMHLFNLWSQLINDMQIPHHNHR